MINVWHAHAVQQIADLMEVQDAEDYSSLDCRGRVLLCINGGYGGFVSPIQVEQERFWRQSHSNLACTSRRVRCRPGAFSHDHTHPLSKGTSALILGANAFERLPQEIFDNSVRRNLALKPHSLSFVNSS
jgi:hypothetical protein